MHKRPHSARRGCGPSSEARPGLTTHSTVCLHCCICGSLSRSQFCSCHDTFIYTLSCSAICAVQHRKTSRPYAHRKAEQWSHLLADQKMSHTHLKSKPLCPGLPLSLGGFHARAHLPGTWVAGCRTRSTGLAASSQLYFDSPLGGWA